VERDDPGVVLALDVAPRDALVRQLLGDLGVPLVRLAAEARAPVQAAVVKLADLVDALHELWEVLELRPLVVRGGDGRLHFDRLLDRRHAVCLLSGCSSDP